MHASCGQEEGSIKGEKRAENGERNQAAAVVKRERCRGRERDRARKKHRKTCAKLSKIISKPANTDSIHSHM